MFDYVDGAADEEIAVAANVAAFRSWRFLPRVLAGVAVGRHVGPGALARRCRCRSLLGPTGYTRMLHPDGEIGGARSAAAARAAVHAVDDGDDRDRGAAGAVVGPDGRAVVPAVPDQGPGAVVRPGGPGGRLAGTRRWWSRSTRWWRAIGCGTCATGFRSRLSSTLATIASVASKPMTGPRLRQLRRGANDDDPADGRLLRRRPELVRDIEALRARWPGKLLLKGPVGPADARRAVELGLDGVQLSNHGGRQLDRTVAPADLIAPVRAAVGPSFTVLVDSGVRHGADVAIALALGADAAVLGRAYLYGLMAGGSAGVDRALDLIAGQFLSTMQFLGMTSVAELRKHGADLLTRATVLRAGPDGLLGRCVRGPALARKKSTLYECFSSATKRVSKIIGGRAGMAADGLSGCDGAGAGAGVTGGAGGAGGACPGRWTGRERGGGFSASIARARSTPPRAAGRGR